jgi:hypothetical protein
VNKYTDGGAASFLSFLQMLDSVLESGLEVTDATPTRSFLLEPA